MSNQEIINRAAYIVRRHLEEMDDLNLETAVISREEMVNIASALAVVGAMYKECVFYE